MQEKKLLAAKNDDKTGLFLLHNFSLLLNFIFTRNLILNAFPTL